MKKTFSININGLLFNIDEDAFEKLNDYLKNLKKHFKNTDGGDDIVNDIEARIAEILKDRLKNLQQIVSMADIDFTIDTLGQPFEMDEETESTSTKKSKRSYSQKRVFRDPDNQIIGGVSSGLAAYFNIDPIIVRLIFVLSILLGGVGLVVYLTLWILNPLATTTAEKIEMEGNKVDIHTIEKKVREEIDTLKVRFENFSSEAGDVVKKKRKDSENGLTNLGHFLYNAFRTFIRALAIIFGIIFLVIGVSLSLALAAAYLGLTPTIQFDEFSVEALSIPNFLNNFIITTPYEMVLNIAVFLVIFIPIISLIFNGIRLIFNLGRQKVLGVSAIVIWVVALMVAFTLSLKTVEQFKTESKQIYVHTFSTIESDTLNILVYNQQFYKELQQQLSGTIYFENEELIISSDDEFYGNAGITYSKSDDDNFALIVRTSVRGKNTMDAKRRLENTKYHFEIKDNNLEIDPFFTLSRNEKWRNQEVTFDIKVPEGKTIYLDKETKRYFQWYYWHHNRRNMVGNYWIMTDDGLELPED